MVNGVVRPGPGLVARPLRDLPEVAYQAVHAPGARDDERTDELLATIAVTMPP